MPKEENELTRVIWLLRLGGRSWLAIHCELFEELDNAFE
jgi:hypothetical protein